MKKLSFFLMAMLLAVTNAWGETADVKFSSLYSTNTTLDGTAITITDGITATFNKRSGGTATQYYTNGTAVRWYGGGNLNITSTVGNITAITITYTQTANSVNSTPAGYTLNNKSGNWTGDATSVTFTQSGTSGHCRISQIAVTYTTSGSVELKETLTDEQFAWDATKAEATMPSTFENEPTLINILDLDVTYTSSNANVAKIDASTGAITLVAAGTTTISAFYEGGDDAGEGKVYAAKTVSYTLTVKPAPLVIEPIEGGIIDILTHDCLTANSSNYAVFSSKQAKNDNHSDAVYAGRSSRNGNDTQYSIQLNTIDKGRIATTTTGGLAKRVYVRWATQGTLNTDKRSLYIYGSNDAFTGSETTEPSTKIGTVTFTTGAEEAYADLTGDYKHILITGSGAIYMDEIQVTWVSAEGTVVTPTISGDAEFIESTEVTISAEDGLKVYYTLDGTDPTNASTEYTAPFELTATTTVKAVAYDGENASDIISKTFKQLQVLTCEEAAELCAATESTDKYVIRGYVTNIAYAYDASYNNISFWMADTKNGGKVFEAYRAQPVAAADKAVKVGDYVEVIGKIVLYNTTPETSAGGTYTIIPAPVVNHTITVSANPAEAGTVTGGGEFEETDEITVKAVANEDYEFTCWTEGTDTVATTAEYTFEVLANRNLVANFKKAATEVVLENAYKEVYSMWNRAKFFGEHATYGDISVQVDNYNGYGTYEEGVSSRINDVKVNGSATFVNNGETDLLTATLTDAEGTVYIVKAEVAAPKTYNVVATEAQYTKAETWSVTYTVTGLSVDEENYTLTIYAMEEGNEASMGEEGAIQGLVELSEVEGVLTVTGTLKDAAENKYVLNFTATPKASETYTLTFEDMVIEPGQWDDNLHITAENAEYAIEFQLFGGKTKGYGEYGFTDGYPDVDEVYINFEYAQLKEGTVAKYYKNEETGLATIEATFLLGIDTYIVTLTGQPLVNPEDIVPTDTINITMTEGTIGLVYSMVKVAASSEEAELSILLVGEDPYNATTNEFAASSYLVTTAGSLTFLRGGLEIVEVGDVKIAYIGVLCSDHKWYNIVLTTGTEAPTALDNLNTTVAPVKMIENGQLIIINNGVQYNAQGQVIK